MYLDRGLVDFMKVASYTAVKLSLLLVSLITQQTSKFS